MAQVDCTPNTLHCGGTGGCVGAVPQLAFMYASLFGVVGGGGAGAGGGIGEGEGVFEGEGAKVRQYHKPTLFR